MDGYAFLLPVGRGQGGRRRTMLAYKLDEHLPRIAPVCSAFIGDH